MPSNQSPHAKYLRTIRIVRDNIEDCRWWVYSTGTGETIARTPTKWAAKLVREAFARAIAESVEAEREFELLKLAHRMKNKKMGEEN
jgi:hypothetical protein